MKMNCKSCGTEIEVMVEKSIHLCAPVDKRLLASTYDIPFCCGFCGGIKFQYHAIRGVVFVWPLYRLDKRFENKNSKIIIPEFVKKTELSDTGIILSVGPGFYDKKHKDKWRAVVGLCSGMKVIYDCTVPWGIDTKGSDGRFYYVKICDFSDVSVEIAE